MVSLDHSDAAPWPDELHKDAQGLDRTGQMLQDEADEEVIK